MNISQDQYSRRTFLRGSGALVALPFLEALAKPVSAIAANGQSVEPMLPIERSPPSQLWIMNARFTKCAPGWTKASCPSSSLPTDLGLLSGLWRDSFKDITSMSYQAIGDPEPIRNRPRSRKFTCPTSMRGLVCVSFPWLSRDRRSIDGHRIVIKLYLDSSQSSRPKLIPSKSLNVLPLERFADPCYLLNEIGM